MCSPISTEPDLEKASQSKGKNEILLVNRTLTMHLKVGTDGLAVTSVSIKTT